MLDELAPVDVTARPNGGGSSSWRNQYGRVARRRLCYHLARHRRLKISLEHYRQFIRTPH